MSDVQINAFVKNFTNELLNNNAVIFAGAGLSVGSGHVDWRGLLRGIATELGLDVDRESNLISVAQFHVNQKANRSALNQQIVDEFTLPHDVNENHKILARLPITTYWTTNYDKLIETALTRENKVFDVKYTTKQLKLTRKGRDGVIYKMHGDVDHADDAIITKDDYEGYFRKHEAFVTALSGQLTSKTFLFLGFSFSDPNIDYVMSRVRVTLRNEPKDHYCILRREKDSYKKLQQTHFIRDLSRIGIEAILVDKHSDLTTILLRIEERYRKHSVFISGSVSDMGSWTVGNTTKLLEQLSRGIIKRKLRIVTGFGLGVGPPVLSGALQEILENPRRYSWNQLLARPFPVSMANSYRRARIYAEYRNSIVKESGIAIFAFGNKQSSSGRILPADGVRKEFEIARAQKLSLVPIGATGSMAEELWKEVYGNFSTYYPTAKPLLKIAFKKLGDKSLSASELAKASLRFIDLVRDD